MLKHVVIVALSLAGASAPYAAERAAGPITPVSKAHGVTTPERPAIDPAKQAWVRHAINRLLDAR